MTFFWCSDCQNDTKLDIHGRCSTCQSNAVAPTIGTAREYWLNYWAEHQFAKIGEA